MKRRYLLGGLTFATKQQIKQHCRTVVAGAAIGESITDPPLLDLLRKHPEWREKSKGIKKVTVGIVYVSHAGTRCKAVLIETETGINDITWSRLIDRLQWDGSLRQIDHRAENLFKIKVAARAAIQPQIDAISRSPGDQIDHKYPRTFDRLLYIFLKWWGAPIGSIEIYDKQGDTICHCFKDWELLDSWQEFHRRVAKLRAIPAAMNQAAPIYPVNWSRLP